MADIPRASTGEKTSSRLLQYGAVLQPQKQKLRKNTEKNGDILNHLPRSRRGRVHHHAPQQAGVHDRLDLKTRGSLAGGELGDRST